MLCPPPYVAVTSDHVCHTRIKIGTIKVIVTLSEDVFCRYICSHGGKGIPKVEFCPIMDKILYAKTKFIGSTLNNILPSRDVRL